MIIILASLNISKIIRCNTVYGCYTTPTCMHAHVFSLDILEADHMMKTGEEPGNKTASQLLVHNRQFGRPDHPSGDRCDLLHMLERSLGH